MSERISDGELADLVRISEDSSPPLYCHPGEIFRVATELQSERAWRKRIADCDPALVDEIWERNRGQVPYVSPPEIAAILRALAAVQKEQNGGR